MKTLKDQLIDKGFAPDSSSNTKNVGEALVTGELEEHRKDAIESITRSLYKTPTKLYDRRERHGRTKTVEVKKIMEEMKVDRDTSTYKLIALMRKDFTLMNVREIYDTFIREVKITTHAAVQQMVSKLYRSGVLHAESVVGSVGMKYKIVNPALSADELYIKYIEWLRATEKKKEPKAGKKVVHSVPVADAGGFNFRGLRDALKDVIPNTITVNINHRIEVVFTTEKKGKK